MLSSVLKVWLFLAVALVGAQQPRSRDLAPGCFNVTFARWQPGGEGRAFYEPLPTVLELRATRDSASRDLSYIGYRFPRGPEGSSRITWRRLGRDTVAIALPRGWSAGLGIRVTTASSSDTLVGLAEDHADYSPRTTLRAQVRLSRTQCNRQRPG